MSVTAIRLIRHQVASLLLVLAVAVLPAASAVAAAIDTKAREAILIDATTGTVLFEKNADQRMPTSSMSKIMTMYVVFKWLDEGRLSLDDTLPVSEAAWSKGGSKMFVELGNDIRVEDLIRGVIVQSGNDASIVLAESIAGSEAAFADIMNEVAREIGLVNSNFTNATGWPDENHYSTARDLALLAYRLIVDYPQYYHYYSETEFTYHDIRQGNRNPLLYRDMGADGLKTGHTEAAGYGLTASAVRDGRRLILVVNGLSSVQERADEAARLMEWGFREFDAYTLFEAGDVVDEVPVWMGADATVPVTVPGDLVVTMNREERDGLEVKLVLDEPVPAPIRAGQQIGTLVISAPDFNNRRQPVVAAADVERLGVVGRVLAGAHHLIMSAL